MQGGKGVFLSGKQSLPEQRVEESLTLLLLCSLHAQIWNAARSLLCLLHYVLEGEIIMFCWVGPNWLLCSPNRTKNPG